MLIFLVMKKMMTYFKTKNPFKWKLYETVETITVEKILFNNPMKFFEDKKSSKITLEHTETF